MYTNLTQTGFVGSANLETSVADEEILTKTILNFSLQVDYACHVLINGGSAVYLRQNQIVTLGKVKSLKFVENGITFNWIGVEA